MFAERGCKKLFLVDISVTGLAATKDLIDKASPGAQVAIYEGNIGEEDSVQSMVDECIKVFGRLDFACNNAGVGSQAIKTIETTTEYYDKIAHVNERGVSNPFPACTRLSKANPLMYLDLSLPE